MQIYTRTHIYTQIHSEQTQKYRTKLFFVLVFYFENEATCYNFQSFGKHTKKQHKYRNGNENSFFWFVCFLLVNFVPIVNTVSIEKKNKYHAVDFSVFFSFAKTIHLCKIKYTRGSFYFVKHNIIFFRFFNFQIIYCVLGCERFCIQN